MQLRQDQCSYTYICRFKSSTLEPRLRVTWKEFCGGSYKCINIGTLSTSDGFPLHVVYHPLTPRDGKHALENIYNLDRFSEVLKCDEQQMRMKNAAHATLESIHVLDAANNTSTCTEDEEDLDASKLDALDNRRRLRTRNT